MPQTYVNIAYFQPGGGAKVVVEIEGDFTRTVGMRPNVNRVLLPCTEFDKIRDTLFKPGTLTLAWQAAGAADVEIRGVRVLQYAPGDSGRLLGESAARPIEYVLFLADVRADVVAPFGGRLFEGLLNPDANDDGQPDVDQVPLSELITTCCRAMGFTPSSLPPQLDARTPPLNLRWFGVPAEGELAKLLESSGSIMAPSLAGEIGLHAAGAGGSLGSFSTSLIASDASDPAPVGRGDVLVITSAPTAVIETVKLTAADLEFVMPDSHDVWKPIDDPDITFDYWTGHTADQQMRLDFSAVVLRDVPKKYAFRSIRVKADKYKPALQRLLRRVVTPVADPNSTQVKIRGLSVKAVRAYKQSDGRWVNSTEPMQCSAEYLIGPNVIVVSEVLGTVTQSPAEQLRPSFKRAETIEVELSVESVVPSADASRDMPEYASFAYRRKTTGDDGPFTALTEDESAELAFAPEPATVFVNVPSLRRVRDLISGPPGTDNFEALKAVADKLAAQYFSETAVQTRTIVLAGFHRVELDGRIHEVRYNQQSLSTVIVMDQLPPVAKTRLVSNLARQASSANGGGALGSSPADPLALGTVSGGVQPSVPIAPVASQSDELRPFVMMRIGNATKREDDWIYEYQVTEVRRAAGTDAVVDGFEDVPNGRTGLAYNVIEENNDTSGVLGNGIAVTFEGYISGTKIKFLPVPRGTVVVCFLVRTAPQGTSADTAVEYWFTYANGMDGPCS